MLFDPSRVINDRTGGRVIGASWGLDLRGCGRGRREPHSLMAPIKPVSAEEPLRIPIPEDEPAPAEPCACAPCNRGRCASCPVPLIILIIICINYIPYLWMLSRPRHHALSVCLVVIFHILLALLLLSWVYTCATDPGTPPARWQRAMSQIAQSGQQVEMKVCRTSGLYKPPRSHYCSTTQRLTLNMDHFCPWVVNTVGYYNRKFFLLFLYYSCFTMVYTLVVLLPQLPDLYPWAKDEAQEHWFPGVMNVAVLITVIVVDVVMLLVLLPFLIWHIKMARKNQTTIEQGRFPEFDISASTNLRQVFGNSRLSWWIPLYLGGPGGDGLSWPIRPGSSNSQVTVAHMARNQLAATAAREAAAAARPLSHLVSA